jgi:membrane protease YdiL (CAAX protease family)
VEHLVVAAAPAAVAWEQVVILLLPLPVIVAGNIRAASPPEGSVLAALAPVAGALAWLMLGVVAVSSALFGPWELAVALASPHGASSGQVIFAAVMTATGLIAIALLARPTRELVARVLPIDPGNPVHATALVLSVILAGSQLASQLSTDVLSQQAQSGVPLQPIDLVAQELPFLLAAFAGVGLGIRRSPRAALSRLGVVRPSAWQVVLGLAAAGLFFAIGNGIDTLGHVLTPGVAGKVDAANGHLFSRLGDPVGIATIALTAGICEEVLFRGALQPRLGIIWPALLFAAIHTQYGLSLDSLAVFVLAIGLGVLRRFTNTTTTIVCHVMYDALVGIGVGGVWLVPALIVETALLLGGLAALLTGRLGSLRTAQ